MIVEVCASAPASRSAPRSMSLVDCFILAKSVSVFVVGRMSIARTRGIVKPWVQRSD